MSEFSLEFLQAVVDTLLPGLPAIDQRGALPSATQLRIDQMLAAHLATHPHHERLAQWLRNVVQLAGDTNQFMLADQVTRTALLQALECTDSATFHAFLLVVAADYYQAEEVIRWFGWPVEPPQPGGYPLPKFDEQRLTAVKQRGKLWRE